MAVDEHGERAALVTGGGTGMGYATAEAFVRRGVDVTICGRREDVLEAAVERLTAIGPGRAVAAPGDLALADVPAAMVGACRDAFGRVDVVVNNAGVGHYADLTDLTAEDWDRMFAVTLRAAALTARAAAPLMAELGGGRIVNVASINARLSEPSLAHYSAAKAGLVSLTQSTAVDLAGIGVQANCVAPGWVRTPMSEPFLGDVDAEAMARVNLLGRVGEPEEIANVVAYFALDAPDYLTGQTLYVDGGQSAMAPMP